MPKKETQVLNLYVENGDLEKFRREIVDNVTLYRDSSEGRIQVDARFPKPVRRRLLSKKDIADALEQHGDIHAAAAALEID